MARVDVLIPSCDRVDSLVMTLAGVAAQSLTDLHAVVADQSAMPAIGSPVVQSLLRVIEARGGRTAYYHRPERKGIAEQRDFLLGRAEADACLFIDDDVFMQPWVVERLEATLRREGCGFVGAFPAGLSYRRDERPEQQIVQRWESPVQPEVIEEGTPAWERWNLHRAANMYHAAQRLPPGEQVCYKVAWIGACVLYDRAKLLEVGGFSFWRRLPRYHSGEEVLVQQLLLRRWGGCGILPSGTYFSEVPTTTLNEVGTVEGHALDLLPEMIARYAPVAPTEADSAHEVPTGG